MKKDIEDLFENIKKSYKDLISKFNLNNFDSSNSCCANIEIKHVLEDLRSIYDYVAVDINDKFCHCTGKIYFPYADKNTNQVDFTKKLLNRFSNVPQYVIDLIIEIQHFKSNKEWLINLMDLTNNVKHIELSINKIRIERKTTYTDGKTSMVTTGTLKIAPYGNGYGFFGTGNVYVNGNGQVNFYGNGIVKVGNGTLDINNPSKTNLDITYEERNVLQFKLIEKDVYEVLNEIINGTEVFLFELKKLL